MAQKPSNLPMIVVVIAAGAALIGVNAMQLNSDPQIREKKAKEAEREAAKKQQATQTKSTPQGMASAEMVPGAGDVAIWGAEKSFGKAGGKPVITLAWEWTPALQANPSSLYTAAQVLTQAFPDADVRAVSLDATPGTFQPGVSVDGSLREPVAADGTFPQIQQIVMSLKKTIPETTK